MRQYTPHSRGSHVWLHIHLHLSPCLHAIAAMAAIFMSAGPPLRARDFLTENLIKRIQDAGANDFLDMVVAFHHPITGKPVFFIPDFPHVVKKVVNALDNDKRELTRTVAVDGTDQDDIMCLQQLKDVWDFAKVSRRLGDALAPEGAANEIGITTDKFKEAHFIKTPSVQARRYCGYWCSMHGRYCIAPDSNADVNPLRSYPLPLHPGQTKCACYGPCRCCHSQCCA